MISLHAFGDATSQASALARAVGDALAAALASRGAAGRATLAVSGGASPKLFLETLAHEKLDWSRIDVTLVDDRWVGADDAASNQRFVSQTLLTGAAAVARFIPLVDVSQAPDQAVAALNAAALPAAPDVAVLGMGEDGHTASLFADAPEWHQATTTTARYAVITPQAAPHQRVSMTLSAIRAVPQLFLQIGGAAKRAVLDESLNNNPDTHAISKIVQDKKVTLDVYWFA
ncbi:MAG: 6-phosphogluconolactonase [Janthinobacterium lividum]